MEITEQILQAYRYKAREKQILAKLFITKEQLLKEKEETLEQKQTYYEEIDKVNTRLKKEIGEIDNVIGTIFRSYELKSNPSEQERLILRKIWEYLVNELSRTLAIPVTKYEEKRLLSLKIRESKEELKSLRQKRAELSKGSHKEYNTN